jgi:hypothetical protein
LRCVGSNARVVGARGRGSLREKRVQGVHLKKKGEALSGSVLKVNW